jgi:hypothetical protein
VRHLGRERAGRAGQQSVDTQAEPDYAARWTSEGTSGEKTVTEAEWLACTDPKPMLEFLRGKASERKLRLFAAACCRRVWEKVPRYDQHAVETAEHFADGNAAEQELVDLQRLMDREYERHQGERERFGDGWASAYHALGFPAWEAANSAFRTAAIAVWIDLPGYQSLDYRQEWPPIYWEVRASEYAQQAGLLRDLFGNPFRLVTLSPAILTWNDSTVIRLAQAAYDERHLPAGTLDSGRLAVLADALEEAGCSDADILGHLRGPGPHVRGCWAVDLCLGKS